MTPKARSRLLLLLPVAAAVCGLALLSADPLYLQTLRNGLFDQYQRWHPRAYPSVPVRIIDIDEASLERLGQWPWPRTRLAHLVDQLVASGVAAIGFDMVFAEHDRTSPRAVVELWPLEPAWRKTLAKLPDHDQVFAQSIGRAPVVLAFALDRGATQTARNESASEESVKTPARPYRYINAGDLPDRQLHDFTAATISLPVLEQAARGNGAMSFVPDSDGVVRRVPLALKIAGQPVSTLLTEVLRVGLGEKNIFLEAADGKDAGLSGVRIGASTIPTTAQGEMWVHYSEPVSDRYIPAWKVVDNQVPKALLDGHLVLLGTSAPGLMDMRFSALGRIVPGVEVHAQALEQILSGEYLQRPSWARAVEAIVIVAGTLLIGFLSLRAGALKAAVASVLVLATIMGGGWIAFREYGLLLDTVTPAQVVLTAFVLCSLIHHWVSEREQRWIKAAFSRYVSPNRVAHLVDNPSDIALGGHRQTCSFIFTDLAGFTRLMESIDASDAVALLNTYIDQMIAIAFRHEGTLDRIVGDAVAIMFSAPVPQPDHQARALACGMEMEDFASRYAEELQARGIGFGKTRIGIHSGDVIVGNFGGSAIFDYRALGDAVNTAARLESVNKHLGTTFCISETTLAGCPEDVAVRPVGRLVLQGKHQALKVYEPVSSRRARGDAPEKEYCFAYDLMAQHATENGNDGTTSALGAFRDLSERYPDDPLVALHLKRLSAGMHGDQIVMSEK